MASPQAQRPVSSDRAELGPTLRPGRSDDAASCGEICFEAFGTLAQKHGFESDFPSPDVAIGIMSMLLSHPSFYSVVAESDGEVLGSNFLDERSPVAGVGPLTIRPSRQNQGLGRALMEDVLARAAERGFSGVRLCQAAYHNRSLALYASLGFELRETLACMQGTPAGVEIPGYRVRPAAEADLEACNAVCTRVHGHDRGGEVLDAIHQQTALVVEHDDRVSGYATSIGFFGHAVGETNQEIKALIGATSEIAGPGVLVPARNSALVGWCLENNLRLVQVMTLMSLGLYGEPAGAYTPSVLY